MSIDAPGDWDGLRAAGRVAHETLSALQAAVRVGISTAELDRVAFDLFARHGARSAPQLVYDFPGTVLICVNDEIVHGVPGPRRLCAGDLAKLDVTVEKDGYVADAARSVIVAPAGRAGRSADAGAAAGAPRGRATRADRNGPGERSARRDTDRSEDRAARTEQDRPGESVVRADQDRPGYRAARSDQDRPQDREALRLTTCAEDAFAPCCRWRVRGGASTRSAAPCRNWWRRAGTPWCRGWPGMAWDAPSTRRRACRTSMTRCRRMC